MEATIKLNGKRIGKPYLGIELNQEALFKAYNEHKQILDNAPKLNIFIPVYYGTNTPPIDIKSKFNTTDNG